MIGVPLGLSAEAAWGIVVLRSLEPLNDDARLIFWRYFSPPSLQSHFTMFPLILPIAAAGWSMLYLLFGGGLFGAIVIFIVAKLLGK